MPTDFDLYMEKLVKALFKQLRNETPQKFFPEKIAEKNKPTTRWSQKGLFSSTYCRTEKEIIEKHFTAGKY